MAARLSALRAGRTLPPGFFIFKDSWSSFLLEAESTLGDGLYWLKPIPEILFQTPPLPYTTTSFLTYFCGYRAFTVASCAKGWRDNHDLILHTSPYIMWYRTYRSELYQQLSSVDLTRTVYITPHVTFRFQGFNQFTSLDTLIVIVEMRLASLLWDRVYPAVA
jgi:hypothetical protein